MRWRAEQFGAARAAELAAQTVTGTSLLDGPPASAGVAAWPPGRRHPARPD